MWSKQICFWLCVLFLKVQAQDDIYELNILHYNDFHARFVETSPAGTVCNNTQAPCIGGFARLTTLVRERLKEEQDSLLLNAGDSFQGTIWFNLLGWNVTQEFMNILPHDAHVLGNHEFDNGLKDAIPYIKALNSPVVTANINDTLEEEFQGIYDHSIVVTKKGKRIGIIGVIIATTNELASTGDLIFMDEAETVKNEAQKLHDEGVDIIVVLSHCGLDIDRHIALNGGPHIDIIVGGHSHTLLYNDIPPDTTAFLPQGPYPVVVEQESRKVLIVQAAAHTQYLGEIKLSFDGDGNLLNWIGNPHYIGNEIEQAPDVLEKVNEYLPIIEEIANAEIGSSLVHMSSDCTCGECNLGNFICDAFMDHVVNASINGNVKPAHFCVINQGGIRSNIDSGRMTYESLILAQPFENNVEAFDLRGDHILNMWEFAVANDLWPGARMLQVSGMQPIIDGSRPPYNRVVDLLIRCIECDVPRYESLIPEQYYRVVAVSFLGQGGDGFSMVSENRLNMEVLGVDYAILMNYIQKVSPVFSDVDGRITITDPCI